MDVIQIVVLITSCFMTWIFQQCQDPFGNCIRQFCAFGFSVVAFIISIYACIKTMQKQLRYGFQLIPLAVNAVSTLALACIQSQFQQQNIYLIMQVIEIYSYSLLAYSYVGLYLLCTKRISHQQFRCVKLGFIVFSVLCLVTIVLLIVLHSLKLFKCRQTHGLGNLVLFLLEMPIYVVTFYYVLKTKNHFKNQKMSQAEPQSHLLNDEDEYIKIRHQQANMVIISFSFQVLIHIATVTMFFIEDTGCSSEDIMQTENLYEVAMMSLFDMAALIPHLTIPIILYFIPAWNYAESDTIIIIPNRIQKHDTQYTNNYIDSRFENNKIQDMAKRNQTSKKRDAVR